MGHHATASCLVEYFNKHQTARIPSLQPLMGASNTRVSRLLCERPGLVLELGETGLDGSPTQPIDEDESNGHQEMRTRTDCNLAAANRSENRKVAHSKPAHNGQTY